MQWMNDGLAEFGLLTVYGLIAGAIGGWLSQYIFPSWLQEKKHALDEKAETHKLNLRRKELMFQRELEAADAYLALHRKLWPQYRFPDMDWEDACADVAPKLGNFEKELEDYLEKHSVGLTESARSQIEDAKNNAGNEKFEVQEAPRNVLSSRSLATAGQVLELLQSVRNQILNDLKGNLTVPEQKLRKVSAG